MKKIFNAAASVIFFGIFAMAVLACSDEKTGITTGSACSVAEINQKMSQEKIYNATSGLFPTKPKSARVTRSNSRKLDAEDGECQLGICLYRKVIENASNK